MRRARAETKIGKEIGGLDALRVFHDLARAITSSTELDSILSTIMGQVASYFQPESWSLLKLDERTGDYFYSIAAGKSSDEVRHHRVRPGEGVVGWAALHNETLMISDISADPRFANTQPTPYLVSDGHESVLCIPVPSRGRVVAIIQLINSRVDQLSDFTMYFLHVLTDYAAIAIENAASMEKIRELTITDDCTGLFNARHLYTVLASETGRSARTHIPFSLLFIDLDYFKQVNDTHGHLVGSRLLAEVGAVLRQSLRTIDSAYRYGGDEFVALLPHTDKQSAIEVARRIYRTLRSHVFLQEDGIHANVRASFGLATFPEDGASVHELVRAADEMMYLVKNTARDNIAAAGLGLVGAPDAEAEAAVTPLP